MDTMRPCYDFLSFSSCFAEYCEELLVDATFPEDEPCVCGRYDERVQKDIHSNSAIEGSIA